MFALIPLGMAVTPNNHELNFKLSLLCMDNPELECKEVIDILDMYRAITFSYQKLEDKGELESHLYLKFSGFDGNNETNQMAYAQYFMIDLDRFKELRYDQPSPDLNSHMQMMPKYRSMLSKWKNYKDKDPLSKDDIELILNAKG